MSRTELAQKIDHTVLSATTTSSDIEKLCAEAREFQFYSVCVNPYYTLLAKQKLEGSLVKVCTVIGFPLSLHTTEVKIFEAKQALSQGAEEIDMPMNLGEFKSKNYSKVKQDIEAVVKAFQGKCVKVIIGTSFLNEDEIRKSCFLCEEAGAHFVKTSTGFFKPGARVEDIKIMKETLGDRVKIKASGGIRDLKLTKALLQEGACRIGTSSSVSIVGELTS